MPNVTEFTETIKFLGDATNLKEAARDAAESLGDFGEKASGIADKMGEFFLGAAEKGAEFGKESISLAGDFQANMNRIAYITGATTDQMQAYNQAAIDIGKTTTFSSKQASEALANLSQMGYRGADSIDLLKASANAAMLNNIDLGSATETVTSSLHAFGFSASDSGHVLDVMTKASQLGKLSFNDFGKAAENVGGISRSAGQSFEETTAAMLSLTNSGMSASRASETLRFTLVAMEKPNKTAAETMSALGLTYYDATGHMKPYSEIMGEVQQKISGMTQEQQNLTIANLFGKNGILAYNAAIHAQGTEMVNGQQVTVHGIEALKGWTSQLQDSNGTVDKAGQILKSGFNYQMQQLKGSVEEAMITIGTPFLGALSNVLQFVTNLVNKFIDWQQSSHSLSDFINNTFVPVVASIWNVISTKIIPILGDVAQFFIDKVVPALVSFVGYVFNQVIPALVQFAGHIIERSMPVLRALADFFLTRVVPAIQAMVNFVITSVLPALSRMADFFFDKILPVLGQFVGFILDKIVPALGTFIGWLASQLAPVISAMVKAFQESVLPALTKFVGFLTAEVFPTIGKLVEWIGKNIIPVLQDMVKFFADHVIPMVGKFIGFVIDVIIPNLVEFGKVIASFLAPIIEKMVDFFKNFLLPILSKVADFISDTVIPVLANIGKVVHDNIMPVLQGFASALGATIVPTIQTVIGIVEVLARTIGAILWPVLKDLWSIFATFILPVLKTAWDFIANWVIPIFLKLAGILSDTVGGAVKSVVWVFDNVLKPVINGIGTVIGGVVDVIKGILTTAANIIIDIVNTPVNLINTLINILKGAPVVGGLFGWLPTLPTFSHIALAEGTSNYQSDRKALLGEAGYPELVIGPTLAGLARGSQVIPLKDGLPGGGPQTINFAPVFNLAYHPTEQQKKELIDLAKQAAQEVVDKTGRGVRTNQAFGLTARTT